MAISPCIGVCSVEGGKCTACGRTLKDISNWSDMTDEERLQRIRELQQED